jgi:hypothetical protein
MRRSEIVNSVEKVVSALTEANVAESIREAVGSRVSEKDRPLPIESMRQYFVAASQFGYGERRLVDVLELNILEDANFWAHVANYANERDRQVQGRNLVNNALQRIRFATTHLPLLIDLLKQERSTLSSDGADSEDHFTSPRGLFSALVIEEDNLFSKPQRISLLMDGITELYEACAAVNGESGDDLMVVACDSGSDKAFDFMGAAKIIECVKEVILVLWDKVVFFRERKLANHLELVSQALPILDQIAELQSNGKLGAEEAELLRRKVANGAGKFLEAGAIIPEMASVSTQDPRALLAPELKQLVAANQNNDQDVYRPANEDHHQFPVRRGSDDLGEISDDERTMLLEHRNRATSVLGSNDDDSDDPIEELLGDLSTE